MTNELQNMFQDKSPAEILDILQKAARDTEREKQEQTAWETANIKEMNDADLVSEFESYDHANPEYRINTKHPKIKRHQAIVQELNKRDKLQHAKSQQVTMDKTSFAEQEVRRIIINSELEELHGQFGGTPQERNARSAACTKLTDEMDAMIIPVRLTEPPTNPET